MHDSVHRSGHAALRVLPHDRVQARRDKGRARFLAYLAASRTGDCDRELGDRLARFDPFPAPALVTAGELTCWLCDSEIGKNEEQDLLDS